MKSHFGYYFQGEKTQESVTMKNNDKEKHDSCLLTILEKSLWLW